MEHAHLIPHLYDHRRDVAEHTHALLQAVAPLRTGYVQDGDLFEIVPLYPEPRVAALSDEHPLARAGTVHITELTPYRLLQDSADVPEWRGSDFDAAAARNPPEAERPTSVEESLEAVASGTRFIVVPAGLADFYRRPDIRYVQLTGVAPRMVALAYAKNRKMPSIDQFAKIVIAALGSA